MATLQDQQAPQAHGEHHGLTEEFTVSTEPAIRKAPPPKLANLHPFLWFFDPNSWQVYQGQVVPRLLRQSLVKGVQNVVARENRDGMQIGLNLNAMLIDMQNRGRTMIPHEWGPGGRSYCRSVVGTTAHVDCWTTPISGRTEVRMDHKGKVAWLQGLVTSGRLPPCPIHVLEGMEKSTVQQLTRIEERYRGLKSGSPKVESWRHQLKVIREAIAKLDDDGVAGETEDFRMEISDEQ